MRNGQSTYDMLRAIVLGILYNNYTKNVNNLNDELRPLAVVAENGKVVNKTENGVLGGQPPRYNAKLANNLEVNLSNVKQVLNLHKTNKTSLRQAIDILVHFQKEVGTKTILRSTSTNYVLET